MGKRRKNVFGAYGSCSNCVSVIDSRVIKKQGVRTMAKKRKKAKKTGMAKKVAEGEQLDLIDVLPENAKGIIAEVKLYKKYQNARREYLKKEVQQKTRVLELIKAAKLTRMDDGKIRFKYEGYIVVVTPRDDLIRISEQKGGRDVQAEQT